MFLIPGSVLHNAIESTSELIGPGTKSKPYSAWIKPEMNSCLKGLQYPSTTKILCLEILIGEGLDVLPWSPLCPLGCDAAQVLLGEQRVGFEGLSLSNLELQQHHWLSSSSNSRP